jgi:glucose/arabinose dehydrogenase
MWTAPERPEIYAYGLRNPYRFSFDSGGSHALYAADVGQTAREEVDVDTTGGNYGWVFREGTLTNTNYVNAQGQVVGPPGGFTPIDPIGEYTHLDGIATIGGFVYRGSAMPDLYGKYVFGDLMSRIFYMAAAGGTIQEFQYDLTGGGVSPGGRQLYGFGEDGNHELYAMFDNGQIVRLVPEPGGVGVVVVLAGVVMGGRRGRSKEYRRRKT